ncbi:cholinesterase [Pseudovirgaria hyperparasitica]|uniref:Carboxylic ester hydrolase n=1 Tax=Pseudovirgaria hyperparasitica TaxID=470096 RepID=A0A6A6WBK5_9PEZI|nr:cholinesterase [Pseudovirgaria hyperparasitica]KAF2759424.1 cholinesterase [Pseudovirgaria hyperparasitica]
MYTLFSLLAIAYTVSSTCPSATLDSGPIVGTTTSLPESPITVNQFLGVPFAQPPQRFERAKKPATWYSPLNATVRKPSCIQQINYPEALYEFTKTLFNNPPPPENEDCLYLNVFAPASPAPPGGRAVMFWIYGGNFMFGNAGQYYYDGSPFAAYEDVIVITHNYRTNVFGFPSSPEIPLEHRNVGLYDQRLALDWVQRNIHAFGGDPKKVTIFGESAGGISVDMLVTSLTDGAAPFRAAIFQSGQASYQLRPPTNAITSWDTLVKNVSCTDALSQLECVRRAPVDKIRDAEQYNLLEFMPYVDGETQIRFPAAARKARKIANVPILAGSNANDGSTFAHGLSNLTAVLEGYFPGNATLQKEIAALYPLGSNGLTSGRDQINQLLTDYGFQCPTRRFIDDSAAVGIPAWRFYYNASFPNLGHTQYEDLGVYHSSEIFSVFSTYPKTNATSEQERLSNIMRSAWARFAKDPTGGPGWSAVGSNKLDLQVLGSGHEATVTTIDSGEVDNRCGTFYAVYDAIIAASESSQP